jgi:hypothetical protein
MAALARRKSRLWQRRQSVGDCINAKRGAARIGARRHEFAAYEISKHAVDSGVDRKRSIGRGVGGEIEADDTTLRMRRALAVVK